MAKPDVAPTFPETIVFPDVDEATLAREDGVPAPYTAPERIDSWNEYLRKVLPPLAHTSRRAALRSLPL